jgi:murein DD-endopeptidase MepM/ murein hydrolase activator NlpD
MQTSLSFKKKYSLLTAALSAFLFLASFLVVDRAAAQTDPATQEVPSSRAEELKQHISSRADEIKKLESDIALYQVQLEHVGNQKKTLQSAIQTLDLTRAKLGKDTQLTQKKIERGNAVINDLSQNIRQQEERIKKNKQLIADSIYQIAQTDSDTLLEIMLNNNSISNFFQDVDELSRMQIAIRNSIKSLESLKKDLGQKRTSQQIEQKQLSMLNSQLTDQKAIADQNKREQTSLLKETKNQESNYKKLLAEKAARKKQFEREIDDFEAQLRAEIDPNSFPRPGTKVLAYPLDNVFITQKFGKGADARRLYVSGSHNGMDFRASPGTPLKAAADGVIIGTGNTDTACRGASYGKWVMIKHRNGLSSLYGHLELIKVSEGDRVEMGDIIGYSGNSGYSTGPHLHFTVYVSAAVNIQDFPSKSCVGAIFRIPVAPMNAYLDPEAYL